MVEPEHPHVPLAAYLQPQVSPARRARQREAIGRRLSQPRWFETASVRLFFSPLVGNGRRGAVLGWAVALSALAVIVWKGSAQISGVEGLASTSGGSNVVGRQLVQDGNSWSTEGEAAHVALADGSRVDLQPFTSIALESSVPADATNAADGVDLALKKGLAVFDVAHRPQRPFRVHAGGVTVTVLGTRFSVQRETGRVSVSVERGKVLVESPEGAVHLTPGQHWQGPDAARSEATEVPMDDKAVELTELPQGGGGAQDASAASPSRPRANALSPKQLFDASRDARRAGDSRRAAALLEQLVGSFPSDPRAALASFELGRIRMDVLGDQNGGIRAIEQALRLGPRAGFRQDAMARLVRAYDRVGRSEACRAAKRRYLAAYGEGVHAQTVLKHCP